MTPKLEWEAGPLHMTHETDREVSCGCGRKGQAAVVTSRYVEEPRSDLRRWVRPPPGWFVFAGDDPRRVGDRKVIEGPFFRCSDCAASWTPPPGLGGGTLIEAAAVALRSVGGVEAVFLSAMSPMTLIYAVAREHESVDACALREVEARLMATWPDVEIHVRAHQGRDVDSLGLGTRLV